jgi:hypothetical protein
VAETSRSGDKLLSERWKSTFALHPVISRFFIGKGWVPAFCLLKRQLVSRLFRLENFLERHAQASRYRKRQRQRRDVSLLFQHDYGLARTGTVASEIGLRDAPFLA